MDLLLMSKSIIVYTPDDLLFVFKTIKIINKNSICKKYLNSFNADLKNIERKFISLIEDE